MPEQSGKIFDVSRETLQKLGLYAQLLVKWQTSVGLVGKSTIPDLWRRHRLDSAQLLALAPTNSISWLRHRKWRRISWDGSLYSWR